MSWNRFLTIFKFVAILKYLVHYFINQHEVLALLKIGF